MKIKKSSIVKSENKKVIPQSDPKQFPIVGIGASAGGLEALEQFFENMPKNNGMAFVVIQHLDPTHVGIMPELLQRITTMKVIQASDRLKVMPNCVYVIPPNKSMSLLQGALHLFEPIEARGLRLPIDIFFRSMADDIHEKSIGIVLSGMGSDGSLGLKAIKEKSGIVLVQDPETAKFDSMPRSATSSVIADIVARAEELPAKLIQFLKYAPTVNTDPDEENKNKNNLDKIIILLRERTGNDFSLYKKNTLFRRVERRKILHQIDHIQNYVRLLQENPKEVDILFKELLIGVTSFFRDAPVWDKLIDHIIPSIFKDLPDGYVMRAWIPGCSTGEEAYSLAIAFRTALENLKSHKNLSLQIFATDLDNDAIETARKGTFTKNIIADVSPECLKRFFTIDAEGYRVNATIRDMVVFAPQNVTKDPPFTKLDIISCRNMMIYMEAELQKKLIGLFNYSLIPGGILILGSAETIGNNKGGYEELEGKLKIYRKTVTIINPDLIDFPSSFYAPKLMSAQKKLSTNTVENIQALANQILLQRYAPASLLVNDKGDILYITGRTGKYLEPVSGKANWNIHAMAREGLQPALTGAFRKALQTYEPIVIENIKIGTNGGTVFSNVTVQRIESPEMIKGLVLVVFADNQKYNEPEVVESNKIKPKSTGRIKELESELHRSYEELQSMREETQTSQEELKSTNEELQSTNEELQSSNEELMTSKEEMQSLNEELQTVNVELQSKISEYVRANDDMKNLLNSTEIATLFLDKKLNIRRYTDQVINIFKLRNADIGRPFTDQVSQLKYPEIETHARQVLKNLIFVETPTQTHDGRWFNVRIMPYRTVDDRIDGLVLTFIDITVAKKLELKLKELNEELRKIRNG